MGTNHNIQIYLTGVSPSYLPVNPEDTVQWSCPAGPSGSVDVGFATGAGITFSDTGKQGPFNNPSSGVGGTLDITNNGTSSKYTVGNKTGTFSYQVVTKLEGQSQETYTASIQVTTDAIMNDGGNIIEMPMPKAPGESGG